MEYKSQNTKNLIYSSCATYKNVFCVLKHITLILFLFGVRDTYSIHTTIINKILLNLKVIDYTVPLCNEGIKRHKPFHDKLFGRIEFTSMYICNSLGLKTFYKQIIFLCYFLFLLFVCLLYNGI